MARGTLKRLAASDAVSLGIVRAVVCAVFFVSALLTSFENLGRLPVTVLRPTGAMRFVPWSFYELLLTPAAMSAFKAVLLVSLLAATIGFLTEFSVFVSAVLCAFYQGLVRSFGHFNHDEMIVVYFMFVLALAPCGRAFSIDALWRRRKFRIPPRSFIYGYPILLMRVLLAWVYFSSAIIKLRVGGLNYLNADNLPALAILHSLDNLHDTEFRFAFYLPEYKYYLVPLVALTVVWELLFPLAVVSRRARPVILGFGVLFHVSTLFIMNIFFPYQLLMYLIFIDWRRVWRRLRHSRIVSQSVKRL